VLREVIAKFADGPSVLAVFVIDDSGLFQGAIARKDLLSWVAIKAVGGESSHSMSVGNMRRMLAASTAADLIRNAPSMPVVTESTTLEKALLLMMDSGESILPVVDESGKLVGDLRVSEILNAALKFDVKVQASQAEGDVR
jgi:CBS domain-containing protein